MKSCSFPPVAGNNARVLILGSLPGQESLKQQQYYAHPRNAFWRIMGELIGASPELPYAERIAQLPAHGLALWDVCAAAFRPGSLDSNITDAEPNDFNAFLTAHPAIRLICFNGTTAAQLFAKKVLPTLSPKHQAVRREILPSTSPAHAGMSFGKKLALWQAALQDSLAF